MKHHPKELLQQVEELLRKLRGGDDPYSCVPASPKPKPSRNGGGVALPEPKEND